MATAFPTALDDFTNYVDGTTVMEAITLNDMQFAIEALQAKVGIDNSIVTSSHDYKLTNIAKGDNPTFNDSEANAMVQDHSYLTQTAGFVTAYSINDVQAFSAFVSGSSNPVSTGIRVCLMTVAGNAADDPCISFFVGSGKYFEISSTGTPTMTWTPLISGGTAPIDQD